MKINPTEKYYVVMISQSILQCIRNPMIVAISYRAMRQENQVPEIEVNNEVFAIYGNNVDMSLSPSKPMKETPAINGISVEFILPGSPLYA